MFGCHDIIIVLLVLSLVVEPKKKESFGVALRPQVPGATKIFSNLLEMYTGALIKKKIFTFLSLNFFWVRVDPPTY
jgi:hypothetical protein